MISQYSKGKRRGANPQYTKITGQIAKLYKNGDYEAARKLKIERRNLPPINTSDANYRRLRYVRYADDFILGLTAAKSDAEEVKRLIAHWLGENLKLKLSIEKTLITHASTQAARFLGYDIKAQKADDYLDEYGRRAVNGVIGLFVPEAVVEKHCTKYKRNSKTIHRGKFLHDDDFTIVQTYQQEYRGIVQYYLLAQNVC